MASLPTRSTTLRPSLTAPTWRRAALVAVVLGAVASASLAVEALPRRVFEPDLARVVQLMALLKGAIAGLVVALVAWRAGSEIAPRTYGAALAVVAPMVAAPILVSQGTLLGVSSLLFQASLVALAVLAWHEHRTATAAARGSRRAR